MAEMRIPMRAQQSTIRAIQREFEEVLLDLDNQTVSVQSIVFDGADITAQTPSGEIRARASDLPTYLTIDGEDVALTYENGAWVVMNDCEVLA